MRAVQVGMMALESIAGCTAHGALYDLYVDHVRVVPAPAPPPANWVDHGVVAPVGMPTWGPSTIATRWPLQPDTPAIRDLVVAGDGMVYSLRTPYLAETGVIPWRASGVGSPRRR